MKRASRIFGFLWAALGGGHSGSLERCVRLLNLLMSMVSVVALALGLISLRLNVWCEPKGSCDRFIIEQGWFLQQTRSTPPYEWKSTEWGVDTFSDDLHNPFLVPGYKSDLSVIIQVGSKELGTWREAGYSLPWLSASAASFPAFTLLWFLWRRRSSKAD